MLTIVGPPNLSTPEYDRKVPQEKGMEGLFLIPPAPFSLFSISRIGSSFYTSSKQPWVLIPQDAPSFEEFYRIRDVWQESSITRMEPYWRDRQPPAKSD